MFFTIMIIKKYHYKVNPFFIKIKKIIYKIICALILKFMDAGGMHAGPIMPPSLWSGPLIMPGRSCRADHAAGPPGLRSSDHAGPIMPPGLRSSGPPVL